MHDVILTLIGSDRRGLVELVASTIARLGGNWLESRMAHLGGKFAGILRVQVPGEHLAVFVQTMEQLSRDGLKIVVEASAPIPPREAGRTVEVECVGQDRPGVVRDIARVLAKSGANVEELATDGISAPMSGEMIVRARIRASFPDEADLGQLRAELEKVATDLMVEIRVVEAPGGRRG